MRKQQTEAKRKAQMPPLAHKYEKEEKAALRAGDFDYAYHLWQY